LSVFILHSCDILEQVSETERFAQCNFALTGVRVVEVSGIDFNKVDQASDLGVGDMMTLGQRIFSGKLPAKIQVDVRAKNNNSKTAGISGMGWKVFIDEAAFVSGQLNRSVQVAPNSSTNFPILLNVDLMEMMKQESLPQILGIIFGMEDSSKLREMGIYVQIKPSYKTVGGAIKEFPTWITIRP
jgi:hypothetical protein